MKNRWSFGLSLGLVAAVAVAVSACGNAGTSTAGQTAAPSSPPAAPGRPPGASGLVAAVTASTLQVQNPRTGQVSVTFTPSTSFTETVPATVADLAVGDCALAVGAPRPAGDPAGPVAATSVSISPAAAGGGCGSGAGRGRGAATLGTITSVSGGGFVMRIGTSNATRSVTTTATTTFSKTVATDHAALAVGECVTAFGPSDDTGAVTASSISIRQPGPRGCQGGFGGPGGGRGRAGSGAPNTGDTGTVNGA
ncbi:MAG: hypothetical protein JO063_00975 [Pseudonocardiales bacterium]|nr:hypothetical protein [Pseudonocardiales bacterium]MBV9032722.1 hypothetical protein [Pseudonocardiales bacterium]MBW0008685.1 hypothetical protein [Pseudonocardiales bacterium]